MKKAQTLVTMIIFMAIAVTIVAASVIIVASNTFGSTMLQESYLTRDVAESGIENALMRLLRDPSYTGETFTLNATTDIVTVTGDSINKTITSTASYLNYQRQIVAKISYTNNNMVVNFWQDK